MHNQWRRTGLIFGLVLTSLLIGSWRNALADGPPFHLAWSSTESDFTTSLAWGDYDSDGDLDLAVADSGQSIRLYRNNDGTLTSSAFWSSIDANSVNSLAWGDYDGDGDLDLAVGGSDHNRLYRTDSGTLTSSAVWSSSESDATNSLAWGDYDGDGDLDLAVGNSNHNRLYRNDSGTLTPSAVWSSSESDVTNSLAWGDYDGDGDLDLVVGNGGVPNQPNRLYRNDDGMLSSSAIWSSDESEWTECVTWGDYDGDSDLDIAVGNGGHAELYRNDDGALTTNAVWSSNETSSIESIAWGDYDSDGDLDLAVGNRLDPNRLYRNDAGTLTSNAIWSSSESDYTTGIVWGDYDGDGDLDLAVGNFFQPNRLYKNDVGTLSSSAVWSSSASFYNASLAWGDYDGDGDLDLAVGNGSIHADQLNHLYRNDDGMLPSSPVWSSSESDYTYSIAWGDYDGDGDLDLAVGNDGQNRLYQNDEGSLTANAVWSSSESDHTKSVAWGDYDGDGDLDLAVGNHGQANRLYRNDAGVLTTDSAWSSSESNRTYSIAWGDYDSDGDLDLAVGNGGCCPGQSNQLYRNYGGILTDYVVWSSAEADETSSIAWGDYDGDDDLDLVAGNDGQPDRLYRNDNGSLSTEAIWSSVETNSTWSIAWGDYDGDGDLDLATGMMIGDGLYRNDAGRLTDKIVWSSLEAFNGFSVAWGDYDNDGDLDLAVGDPGAIHLYRNTRDTCHSPGAIPLLHISHPDPPAEADFYASSHIWTGSVIPISYTLFHTDSLPVRQVNGMYSLDGGGHWLPAIPTSSTVTADLGTSNDSATYTYNWDTFQSGVMGQSDNVVFRLVAIPSVVTRSHQIPGPYLYGSYAAQTYPFRVRGTQVRVLSETAPISNALVYRLPADQLAGGAPYADNSGAPFRTDSQGYLQGRGQIDIGDRLLAMTPVYTDPFGNYTVYHTSGEPTQDGLAAFTVTEPGVQVLTVTAEHPLILFNVDLSLEWDASSDPTYLDQLTFDLRKASRHLYDFTDGQAALGHVTVHQNGDHWASSHVFVQATNRLRPLAAQGGIVVTSTVDPQHDDITYEVGQVHMGATWNRYGDPGQTTGGDWPLALAHELSHYALFLDDVYLGLNEEGLLIPQDTCTGSAMGDMYAPDNTEFIHDPDHWQTSCADTLANRTLERTEWETIRLWYPWLITPTAANPGPSLMPFDLTTVEVRDPVTPTAALVDPTFYIDYEGSAVSSSEARAFVLRDEGGDTGAEGYERVIDLGSPIGGQNRVLARGAQPGDRLCVFDQPRQQYGCEVIQSGDERLTLERDDAWAPVLRLTPVTSRTFIVQVSNLPSLPLRARLYPAQMKGSEAITLTQSNGVYSGMLRHIWTDDPAMRGHVQVWVDETATETDPRRETIVAYTMGGDPGPFSRGHGPFSRGHGPFSRGSSAPLTSPGGQMIFFTENSILFEDGDLHTIQSMAGSPPLPEGKTAIGQGYSLVASPNVTRVITGSISFQYLTRDVLVEQADEDELGIHFWNGDTWRALSTVSDAYYNMASAPSQGDGVYALLAGTTIPHVAEVTPSAATNDVTTTLTIQGGYFLPPVEAVLIGPTATYTLPLVSVSPTSITAEITRGLPAREYQVSVINQNQPGGPVASPTPGAFALYAPSPPDTCFYDFFESGTGKWETDGDWGLVTLPNGERVMTDSPDGPYKNAVDYGTEVITHTTCITSVPFSLAGCNLPLLTLDHDYVLANGETHRDVGWVEASNDSGLTWETLQGYTGGGVFGNRILPSALSLFGDGQDTSEWHDVDWRTAELGLSGFTDTIRLRLCLEVDQDASDRGWVMDNLLVRAGSVLTTDLQIDLARQAIPSEVDNVVQAGDSITYQLTITNAGPDVVDAAATSLFSSDGVSAVKGSTLCWASENGAWSCHLDDLTRTQALTMVLATQPTYSSTLSTQAIITPIYPYAVETDPDNNQSDVQIVVRGIGNRVYLPVILRGR